MKNSKYKIFVDLDGVLCNFFDEFIKFFQLPIRTYEKTYGKDKTFKVLNDLGKDFWKNLEWMPEGRELWNFLINNFEYVFILSSPGKYDKSIEGKIEWLNKNLDGHWLGNFEENKYKYSEPNAILIDDYEKNINLWNKHGGISILYKSTNETIQILNTFLKEEN